jgi:hypothetical protein
MAARKGILATIKVLALVVQSEGNPVVIPPGQEGEYKQPILRRPGQYFDLNTYERSGNLFQCRRFARDDNIT